MKLMKRKGQKTSFSPGTTMVNGSLALLIRLITETCSKMKDKLLASTMGHVSMETWSFGKKK